MEAKTELEKMREHYQSRMDDLRKLWEAYTEGDEDKYSEDIGNIFEYGLAFDYVAPVTFKDQEQGYFRYQISYGGPSEEFRFYTGPELRPYKIEFWYLDWGTGEHTLLIGDDKKLLMEIFEWFKEGGTVDKILKEAMA